VTTVKRLRIALDCDGVLADCCSGLLRVVEEVTGRQYSISDVKQFDVVRSLDLSAGEAAAYKAVISSRRGLAASLAPYPLARQGVRRLRELGEVFCVTYPCECNPWWHEERDAWLALHFGIDVVHHAKDKTAYEADVFVDDQSVHVRAWLATWSGRTAVLWRTLHNSTESVPCGAHLVGSWEALYQLARDAVLRPVQWSDGGLP
jgi:5'(3')-deoxyribonucleotidase